MHRIVLPTREAINALQRIESPLMTDKTRRYLRDVMDNIMQILDLNDNQSDHLILTSRFVYVRDDLPNDQCDENPDRGYFYLYSTDFHYQCIWHEL